jgi:hypothetical protein
MSIYEDKIADLEYTMVKRLGSMSHIETDYGSIYLDIDTQMALHKVLSKHFAKQIKDLRSEMRAKQRGGDAHKQIQLTDLQNGVSLDGDEPLDTHRPSGGEAPRKPEEEQKKCDDSTVTTKTSRGPRNGKTR